MRPNYSGTKLARMAFKLKKNLNLVISRRCFRGRRRYVKWNPDITKCQGNWENMFIMTGFRYIRVLFHTVKAILLLLG